MRKDLGLVIFVIVATALGFLAWNVAGGLTRDALTPRPSASAVAAATATPAPAASGAGAPSSSASPLPAPSASPTPPPVRTPVKVRIEAHPAAVFATEAKITWCAAAAVQIALNVNGADSRIDTTRARQARIRALEVKLTTRTDSRNGGVGPLGMVATLERLGNVTYDLRIFPSRASALRAAARAISTTGHAPILLAWRGAHAWVMTGYRANADPTVFRNAKVTGAYIIDPWYPRVSSIWGPSDKPGVFQDAAQMRRNFLPWKRPEGRYPTRDGKFLVLVPTS